MRRIATMLAFGLGLAVAVPVLAGATAAPQAATKRHEVVITDVGTLGGTTSSARAVNDHGLVTGGSELADGSEHAFLWRRGGLRDLGTLPGGTSSSGEGINALGDVVGVTVTPQSLGRATAWFAGGRVLDLGTLGGTIAAASDINDRRQIVGHAGVASDGFPLAFVWQSGALTSLGTLGGESSRATAINKRGQIVGSAVGDGPDGPVDAPFLFQRGAMTDLASPAGSFGGSAQDVNDRGWVVGSSFDGSRAFLYRDGVLRDLGFAGSPQAINDRGTIVGSFCVDPACVTSHAFVYDRGTFTDLNTLLPPGSGWELTIAADVNRGGLIVGTGVHDGVQRGFVLDGAGGR